MANGFLWPRPANPSAVFPPAKVLGLPRQHGHAPENHDANIGAHVEGIAFPASGLLFAHSI